MSSIEFTKGWSAGRWWNFARILSTLTIVPVVVIVIGLLDQDAPWQIARVPAIIVFFALLLAGGYGLQRSSAVGRIEARNGYTTLNDGDAALPLFDPDRTAIIRQAGKPLLSRAAYRDALRQLRG